MARVTVEDCVEKVPNRYELLMVAAQRAKDIAAGAPLGVDRDNDKDPVVALREIAEGKVSVNELQMALVSGLQKYDEVEEPAEEEMEIMATEKELEGLDEQFDNIMLESDVTNSMQIQDEESDLDMDLDAEMADSDLDMDDADFDDEFGDDMLGGDELGDGFDDFDE